MAFSDHKIAAFTHKITDLPDQPNLPADELKARFDSSPEELRQAHNALCDDADRLDDRVSGIIAETFGDTIPKSMLADELQDEIDAKATQTALAAEVDTLEAADSAEAAARQSADNALSTRVSSLESAVPQKCQVYVGTYTGNDAESRVISLGVRPKAVLVLYRGISMSSSSYSYGGLATSGRPVTVGPVTDTSRYNVVEIVSNGFRVYKGDMAGSNIQDTVYVYIAFC